MGLGEVLLWFLVGCILVNIVMHAPAFVTASDMTFGFTNNIFAGLTSKKG